MKKTLFWSEAGRVACESCAPIRGSTTWHVERWKPMSVADRATFALEMDGAPVECHGCMAERMAHADKDRA